MSEKPDDIVGHATMTDGSHVPLTRAEADALWETAKAAQAKRAADMPTDIDALHALHDAFVRLRELGWREAKYAPKDGRELEVIEPGSSAWHTGYFRYHNGRDGAGCFWLPDDTGDEWPSHPILYREPPATDLSGQEK